MCFRTSRTCWSRACERLLCAGSAAIQPGTSARATTAHVSVRPTCGALAVTTASRAPFLPNVPSMSETVPGYDTEVWWGLLGPAGMPPDLIAKLSHDFVAALNTDSVKQRLSKLGAAPIGSSPQQFDEKIRADYKKWGPIIQAAGMKAE